MKHIKKFNESFEMNPRTMDIVDKSKKFLGKRSPEEIGYFLENILDIEDFVECTNKMRSIKEKFPFITEEEPYKSIWLESVKKWQEKLKKV